MMKMDDSMVSSSRTGRVTDRKLIRRMSPMAPMEMRLTLTLSAVMVSFMS